MEVVSDEGRLMDTLVLMAKIEIEQTSDPHTLFRGNSLASKAIDTFMKVTFSPTGWCITVCPLDWSLNPIYLSLLPRTLIRSRRFTRKSMSGTHLASWFKASTTQSPRVRWTEIDCSPQTSLPRRWSAT
jgi:hypothetical protein